jgi:hypothetical protein
MSAVQTTECQGKELAGLVHLGKWHNGSFGDREGLELGVFE